MADPIPKPEQIIPKQLIVGETKVYLTSPQLINGEEVSEITIQSADKRGIEGANSSVLLVREASRKKGNEGVMIDKPMMNLNDFDEVSWDKITGIQYQDSAGNPQMIAKDQLSLDPVEKPVAKDMAEPTQTAEEPKVEPIAKDVASETTAPEQPVEGAAAENPVETPTETPVETVPAPESFDATIQPEGIPEPPPEKPTEMPLPSPERARGVLENISEDPNTITIIGLKAYQARAKDLAERSMQTLSTPRAADRAAESTRLLEKVKGNIDSVSNFIGNTIWKQSIGGMYFQEKARQYYMDMLQASATPFAESSIRLAEARAKLTYDKMLADKNFIARAGTKAVEWFKGGLGARTIVQKFALEEIRAMKESGELKGMDTFDREAKAVRLRFSQDMASADKFVRTNLGEKLEILDPENTEHQPLVEGVQSLMKRYANGEIADRAAFDAESKQFFQTTLKDAKPEIFAEAELYSSSLFDAAEVLREKASHEGGLANLDADIANMKIRLGLGQMGEVTSVQPDIIFKSVEKAKKIAEWIESKNIPFRPILFNEATIGSGVAIALSVANLVKTMPARVLVPFVGGTVAGGAFAGMREYRKLQAEYLTHVREREVGTTFGEHLKKRAWFEKFLVKQRNADDLIGSLQTSLYDADGALKATLSADEIRTSIATLADIQARKTLSETGLARKQYNNDIQRIGLIQYSGRENIESQRTALDVVSNKALTDLGNYAQTHEAEMQELFGGNTFEDFVVKVTSDQARILKEGVKTLDTLDDPTKNVLGLISSYAPEAEIVKRRWPLGSKPIDDSGKALGIDAIYDEFKKEARVEAIKYGIKQGIVGAATGAVLHEVFSLIGGHGSEIISNTSGKIKDAVNNVTQPGTFAPQSIQPDGTMLEGTHMTGEFTLSTPDHSIQIGNHDYQLPKELEIVSHAGKEYDAILHGPLGKDVVIADHMSPQDILTKLQSIDGIKVVAPSEAIPPTTITHGTHIPDLLTKYHDPIDAQLPTGYHFDHITPTGHPDSWTLLDNHNNPIATGMQFNADGSLANLDAVKTQLAEHGFNIDTSSSLTIDHPGAVVGPDGIPVMPEAATVASSIEAPVSPTSEMMTLQAKDMGDGGLWDYFLKQSSGPNNLAQANGMKNLFRLYEYQHNNDNIHFPDGSTHDMSTIQDHLREATLGDRGQVQEFNIARIPSDASFDLPKHVFGPEGIKLFSTYNDAAIEHYQQLAAEGQAPMQIIDTLYKGSDTDKLHAIVLRLGYIGQDNKLPSDADIQFLMNHMGGTATGVTTAPVVTPIPLHTEIPVDPVVTHPIRIFTDGVPATPGQIIAEKAINVPYLTPTQMQEVAEKVAETTKAIEQERVAATAFAQERGWDGTPMPATSEALKSTVDTAPWIPIFIPHRRGLESAYVEPVVLNPESTVNLSSTMLAPFGVETALLTQEQLAARTSPRLIEKPDSVLNPSEEVSWYLSNLTEEEKALNTELLSQVTTPMTETTKAAILIPAYNSGNTLSETINKYVGQVDSEGKTLDPKSYELVIFNAKNAEAPDEVKSIVDQLKTDHPDAQITYMSHDYADAPTNGKLKRDITNALLQRIEARVLPEGSETTLPEVAIINDAGVSIETPPTYLSSMIEGFSNPSVDMVNGQFKYPNEVYEQLPMIFAQHRAYELIDALTRHTHGDNTPNIISGNTAVRASTLAAVGGYNAGAVAAEDRELAWMIQKARANPDTITTLPDSVSFDPKPVLYQMLQRANLAEPTVPLENNETFKAMSWQDMGEKLKDVYTKDQLSIDMTNLYNGLYPQLRQADQAGFDRNFNFALDSMGLAHEVVDGKVTILDESKLASAITGIPDIESFAAVTAKTFIEQDATAREILSNMAGTPTEAAPTENATAEIPTDESGGVTMSTETPVSSEQGESPATTESAEAPKANEAPLTDESLASTISSPDVINIGQLEEQPMPKVESAPQPQPEQLPAGINDRIDYVLEKHKNEPSATVPVSPAELMDYLKTSLDIGGVRVLKGEITHTDGKLHLKDLTSHAPGGEYVFNADLKSDPEKGLIVDPTTLKMKLPLLGRFFSGTIKNYALNLSDNMLAHIDERTNPMWKASRIDLVGEKIEISFNKKV